MAEDRKITLRRCDLDDWFVIEWAEHDGQMWLEPLGPQAFALRSSARIGDADVEGTRSEMRRIAEAIEAGQSASAYRCAVQRRDDGNFHLWSPRNSTEPAIITAAQARHLASEIWRVTAEATNVSV